MTYIPRHLRRRKGRARLKDIHINVPEDVLAAIYQKLYDPIRLKLSYGGLSILINGLLKKWLEDPDIFPLLMINEDLEETQKETSDAA